MGPPSMGLGHQKDQAMSRNGRLNLSFSGEMRGAGNLVNNPSCLHAEATMEIPALQVGEGTDVLGGGHPLTGSGQRLCAPVPSRPGPCPAFVLSCETALVSLGERTEAGVLGCTSHPGSLCNLKEAGGSLPLVAPLDGSLGVSRGQLFEIGVEVRAAPRDSVLILRGLL